MARKDVIKEAVSEVQQLRSHAFENAKRIFAEEMSGKVRKSIDKMLDEELGGGGDPPKGYDPDGEQKRMGDNLKVVGDTGEDLSDEGDGAAIVEDGTEGECDDDEKIPVTADDDEDVDEATDAWMNETDDDDADDVDGDTDIEEVEAVDDEEVDLDETDDADADDDEEVDIEDADDEDDDLEEIDDFENVDEDLDEVDDIEDDEEVAAPPPPPKEETNEAIARKRRAIREARRVAQLQKENVELKKMANRSMRAVSAMKSQIKEVNLFNARLLGLQKINSRFQLSETQVRKVSARFDECHTINEVKKVYRALTEGFRVSRKTSHHKVNRPNVQAATSRRITESTEFSRMRQLANL